MCVCVCVSRKMHVDVPAPVWVEGQAERDIQRPVLGGARACGQGLPWGPWRLEGWEKRSTGLAVWELGSMGWGPLGGTGETTGFSREPTSGHPS